MQMPKPTPADIERFRSIVPDEPDVLVKPMFGNFGAFVNGNMFLGLLGSDIGLKLAPPDVVTLRAIDGSAPFGPADRPMAAYATLPRGLIGTAEGDAWVLRSLAHARAMPPKPKS